MGDHEGRYWQSTPEDRAKVAEFTKQARGAANLTVREFGAPVHSTGAAVSLWEKGTSFPNLYVFLYAAKAGGVWAKWAMDCLEAGGWLDYVPFLSDAFVEYKNSTKVLA